MPGTRYLSSHTDRDDAAAESFDSVGFSGGSGGVVGVPVCEDDVDALDARATLEGLSCLFQPGMHRGRSDGRQTLDRTFDSRALVGEAGENTAWEGDHAVADCTSMCAE